MDLEKSSATPSECPSEKMAMTLGISSKTVKRHIKDIGIVRFVGRGSNGHWEIIDAVSYTHLTLPTTSSV